MKKRDKLFENNALSALYASLHIGRTTLILIRRSMYFLNH